MGASISVIIPAYNATLTLAETLGSVAGQTRVPHEVIVIDDGSADDTAEIALRFADRLPRLQVISTPNGGVSRARNIGIAAASGDIVAPLDADDLWHPTYLERLGARLEQLGPDAAFAYCSWWHIDSEGLISGRNEVVLVEGVAFYRLLAHNYVGNGSNTLMWRHRLLAAGGFDERLRGNEDYNLQARLAWGGPVGAVPERLVAYRNRPHSLSKQWRLMAEQGIFMLERLRRDLPADRRAMDWALSSAHLHFYFVVAQFRAAGWLEGIRHLLIGARYDPFRTVARIESSVKYRLRQRLLQLLGRVHVDAVPEVAGRRFTEVSSTAEWPVHLPRFTLLRVLESEALDTARAADLGLAPPPPTVLEFPRAAAQGSTGSLAVARQ